MVSAGSKHRLLGFLMLGCFISGSFAEFNNGFSNLDTQIMADTSAVPSYSSRAAAREATAAGSTFSADSDLLIEIDPLMDDGRYVSLTRRSAFDSSVGIASVASFDSKPNYRSAVPLDAKSHAGARQHHTRQEAEYSSHHRHEHDSQSAHDILQAFDDAEQEQHKQHHRPQKGLAWMLGRKSGGHPPHVKQLQHKASEGAAWVQSRIKPLLSSLKAKASGWDQQKRYTRAEVEQIIHALSAEAKAKDRAQAAPEANPEDHGYHDSHNSHRDSYGHYSTSSSSSSSSSSRPQQSKAELYGRPNVDRDFVITPYGAASGADDYPNVSTSEVMPKLDEADNLLSAVQPDDVAFQEAPGVPEEAPKKSPQHEAQHIAHDSKGGRKGAKQSLHQSAAAAAKAEVKKHVKAAKVAHTSSDAALPSSTKAKHKKVYTAAVGARTTKHAAQTTSTDQLLDTSEATEIKNILDAIYGTSRSGQDPGLDSATLSDIQAALQPHFVTDDPESYAFGFGEDSSTGGSIPSEQAALPGTMKEPPTATPSPAKKAPNKPIALPPSAIKTSRAAARSDKSTADVAPAPAAVVDEEVEIVYIEEEVEVEEGEGEDAAFSTEAVPETEDSDAETKSAYPSAKEKTAQRINGNPASSSGRVSQHKSGSDKASAPSDTESRPAPVSAGRSQSDSKSTSGKVAAAGHSTSNRVNPDTKVKTKLAQAKKQEMQPEEEPPLRDTEATRSFSAQWDDEEEKDTRAAHVLSNSHKATKSDDTQQATAAPAQSCPSGSVYTHATKCACKAWFFSKDGTPFAERGCKPCRTGSIAGAQGSTKCRKCAPNTFANREATECTAPAAVQQQ